MTTPIPRHVAGELIREALVRARPAGLHKSQLRTATGLTDSQIANGLIWIREVAAAEYLTPLIYTHSDGYRFSDDPSDWAAYERAQMLRILTTTLRTVKGTVDPHLQRTPDDSFANFISAQANAMISALQVVTGMDGASTPAARHTPSP